MPYDGVNFRWVNRRVHTTNVVFGEVVYKPGGSCGPRIQRDFELIMLHSGKGRVVLNNKTTHKMRAGTVSLFIPGNHNYFEYATEIETHHTWCTISPHFMPVNLRCDLCQPIISVPSSGLLRSLLGGALKLKPVPNNLLNALVENLALCAFAEFIHISSREDRELVGDAAVNSFLRYVADHFAEANCLEKARLASGVSRNTLLNKFHQNLKTTPAHYLWKIRVERGISMLIETGQTISEVAYRCGFKNPYHFSRVLKRQTGRSPKEIRLHEWTVVRH